LKLKGPAEHADHAEMKLENAMQTSSADAQHGPKPKIAPGSRRPFSASFCVFCGQDRMPLQLKLPADHVDHAERKPENAMQTGCQRPPAKPEA